MSNVKSNRVSISDVAKYAGVAKISVSRVINNDANVSAPMRKKVEAAIKELGYRPNAKARSLRSGKSFSINFAYFKPASYYVISLIEGIRDICDEKGYALNIHEALPHGPNVVFDVMDQINISNPDGLILMPPLTDMENLHNALQNRGVPFARISPGSGPRGGLDVLCTDWQAGFDMAVHLLSLGHRDFGYINNDPEHAAMSDRLAGFKAGLKQSGLENNLHISQGFNTFSSGRRAAAELLTLKPRPTAIFAANDDMAVGAIFECHENGLDIPGDMSIAGFDDTQIASHIWPGLTTVHQPIRELGLSAALNLIHRIESGLDPEISAPLKTILIPRRSTGAR